MPFQRPEEDDGGGRRHPRAGRGAGLSRGRPGRFPTGRGRGVAIGATLLAVAIVAVACGSSGSKSSTGGTVASKLVMGGPPECPTRITCLKGLEEIYGLHFKEFKPLDEVGPVTVAALANNQIQVARLDSSDPSIQQNGWVILNDDKHFQQAGNIIPVIQTSKASKPVKQALNKVSRTMKQNDLLTLNTEVTINHVDPSEAATKYVQQKGLGTPSTAGAGQSITVGSAAFSENETLAYIYADVLKAIGVSVSVKANLGSREIYIPALESGQINLIPEYLGNMLSYLNPKVGSLSVPASTAALKVLLKPKGLSALVPSPATDSDAIVVTKATADKYHLVHISDMGKPA